MFIKVYGGKNKKGAGHSVVSGDDGNGSVVKEQQQQLQQDATSTLRQRNKGTKYATPHISIPLSDSAI